MTISKNLKNSAVILGLIYMCLGISQLSQAQHNAMPEISNTDLKKLLTGLLSNKKIEQQIKDFPVNLSGQEFQFDHLSGAELESIKNWFRKNGPILNAMSEGHII